MSEAQGGGESFHVRRGDERSPVILHVPHSSRAIPADARTAIVLEDSALHTELEHMTDAHTDVIAEHAAQHAGIRPWTFVNMLSRLVVDPERFPDEREEMLTVGMGAVYTRTSHGERLRNDDAAERQRLLDRHFHPYAAGMTALVNERLDTCGQAVIIDVHSYPSRPLPYELHGGGERPAICLGTDNFHTSAALLDAARRAFARVGSVFNDTPFGGCYVPLEHYGRDARVLALMAEIRRDTYMTEPGGPPTAELESVAAALTELIDRVPSTFDAPPTA